MATDTDGVTKPEVSVAVC